MNIIRGSSESGWKLFLCKKLTISAHYYQRYASRYFQKVVLQASPQVMNFIFFCALRGSCFFCIKIPGRLFFDCAWEISMGDCPDGAPAATRLWKFLLRIFESKSVGRRDKEINLL